MARVATLNQRLNLSLNDRMLDDLTWLAERYAARTGGGRCPAAWHIERALGALRKQLTESDAEECAERERSSSKYALAPAGQPARMRKQRTRPPAGNAQSRSRPRKSSA